MSQYNKAITAFIASAVSMLAVFGLELNVPEWVVPTAATLISTFMVYWIPNKHPSKNFQ
jgi:hypothetical protein